MSADEIKITIACIALVVAIVAYAIGMRACWKIDRIIRDVKARGPIEVDDE